MLEIPISAYRALWLMVMFDLPVVEKEDRRNYTRFHNSLLKDGFMMLQYSVYARYLPSEEAAEVHRRRTRRALPPAGQVRLLALTDHQFGKMEVYYGKKSRAAESPPDQLLLF